MDNSKDDVKSRLVLDVVTDERPRTVRKLVNSVHQRNPRLSQEEILEIIERLRVRNELILRPPHFNNYTSFLLNLRWNTAFWIFILFSLITMVSLSIPLDPPASLLRLPFILVLFFYFPGRGILRLISQASQVSGIERILLEFAISFVFVLLTGLVLNFSGLGFFAFPAVGTIVAFGFVLTFEASYRDFEMTQASGKRAS
jgi:hypothetical protein